MIPISKRKGLAAHVPSQRLRERSSSVTFIALLISRHKLLMLMSRGQRFCCECTQEEWMEISSARSAGVMRRGLAERVHFIHGRIARKQATAGCTSQKEKGAWRLGRAAAGRRRQARRHRKGIARRTSKLFPGKRCRDSRRAPHATPARVPGPSRSGSPQAGLWQSPHRRRPRANPEHDLTADGRVAHGQTGICWLNVTRYLRTARHSIRALQAIEKSKERIARSVATRRTIQWCCPSERLLFHG